MTTYQIIQTTDDAPAVRYRVAWDDGGDRHARCDDGSGCRGRGTGDRSGDRADLVTEKADDDEPEDLT